MTEQHRIILNAIEDALNQDPELRFGQVLFNLRINEFANPDNPGEAGFKLRDIHSDKDSAIVERIQGQLEWVNLQRKVSKALDSPELKKMDGMTVNERLFISGLIDDFDKYLITNKQFAVFILKRLKVDEGSIKQILEKDGY